MQIYWEPSFHLKMLSLCGVGLLLVLVFTFLYELGAFLRKRARTAKFV